MGPGRGASRARSGEARTYRAGTTSATDRENGPGGRAGERGDFRASEEMRPN